MTTFKQKQRTAAAMVVILMKFSLLYHQLRRMRLVRAPYRNRDLERSCVLGRMYTESDRYCHSQLRMNRRQFHQLCARLRFHGLLDGRYVSIEEQVATFLLMVCQDRRTRCLEVQLFRSSQTVSHYFHLVLSALMKFYREVVQSANRHNSPDDGGYSLPWYHYFKDAVGAIDGTHIPANIPLVDQPSYHNRKGFVSQNVLVSCTFDMKFAYVLVGWEGSAHDGRLLRSAVAPRERRLTLPSDKYYLADAGFPNVRGFMTPYRGTKYHLKEGKEYEARTAKELFNFRHSHLRNVIERTIGLLKKRFAYLRNVPFHPIATQEKIVIACCALHNFIRDCDPNDMCGCVQQEKEDEEEEQEEEEEEDIVIQPSVMWAAKRDAMAIEMFEEFQNQWYILEMPSKQKKKASSETSRVQWIERMDEHLIHVLKEEHLGNGRNLDGTWKTEALHNAVEAVFDNTGVVVKLDHVRARKRYLQKNYKKAKDCKEKADLVGALCLKCSLLILFLGKSLWRHIPSIESIAQKLFHFSTTWILSLARRR